MIKCVRCGRTETPCLIAGLPDDWEGSIDDAVCPGCQYAEWPDFEIRACNDGRDRLVPISGQAPHWVLGHIGKRIDNEDDHLRAVEESYDQAEFWRLDHGFLFLDAGLLDVVVAWARDEGLVVLDARARKPQMNVLNVRGTSFTVNPDDDDSAEDADRTGL